jgi:hypothetical protein
MHLKEGVNDCHCKVHSSDISRGSNSYFEESTINELENKCSVSLQFAKQVSQGKEIQESFAGL